MYSLTFFSKVEGSFDTWIRIRFLNTYPDPATQRNTYPFQFRIRIRNPNCSSLCFIELSVSSCSILFGSPLLSPSSADLSEKDCLLITYQW
jgi:hypothetical protein